MHDQVVIERMEQLALKEERARRDKMEEQMFADLWHADMMAKVRIHCVSLCIFEFKIDSMSCEP